MIRGSGVLLHISSLPSRFGIGDLGPEAYKFADLLAKSGQSYWQVLPLNPTCVKMGNSPYRSPSAFAGNPLFISPEQLRDDGLLDDSDLANPPDFAPDSVDYPAVIKYKDGLFDKAFDRFAADSSSDDYEIFKSENAYWLNGYALYLALKSHFNDVPWSDWPQPVRDRDPDVLADLEKQHGPQIERLKFLQFVFYRQWRRFKAHCNASGLSIIGDIPIYVAYESADMWTNPGIFKLDENRKPQLVSGVPPDYFSQTGQLWGDPVYRWDVLEKDGYSWWVNRMRHVMTLNDIVRIDHFRGLQAYWEIPAREPTAVNGWWARGPGENLMRTLYRKIPHMRVIAEDLGTITPDVRELIRRFELPGMKVLLFAFNDSLTTNPYLPHNHTRNCIVYTGTHDNNTVLGWYENEASHEQKLKVFDYLGYCASVAELHWEFIRMAMMSVADKCIIPMQDILGLGAESRMNTPGNAEGNWRWRLDPKHLDSDHMEHLRKMTEIYARV